MKLAAISPDCQNVAMANVETASPLDLVTQHDIVSPVGRAKHRIGNLLCSCYGEWFAVVVDERIGLLDSREGRLPGQPKRHRGNPIEALFEDPDRLELYAIAAGRVFNFSDAGRGNLLALLNASEAAGRPGQGIGVGSSVDDDALPRIERLGQPRRCAGWPACHLSRANA